MNDTISIRKPGEINEIDYQPAVSIIMPVHHLITPKDKLECRLKLITQKMEQQLISHYSVPKVDSVLNRLKHVISDINYATHKKGIAIFISPEVEKVYYLEDDVEETIAIDEFYEISGQVFRRKTGFKLSSTDIA